jgi:hypothetical protein
LMDSQTCGSEVASVSLSDVHFFAFGVMVLRSGIQEADEPLMREVRIELLTLLDRRIEAEGGSAGPEELALSGIYSADAHFDFASIRLMGRRPMSSENLLRRHIGPAFKRGMLGR